MLSNKDMWFADQVLLSHSKGEIPHGPSLPESMPFVGDFFVTENDDGTDTLWTWWGSGRWDKGPILIRPSHEK